MFARLPEERMAATPSVASIKKHFRRLHDPRVVAARKHLLIDLLVMAICGVIANCDDWPDIALFAQQRENLVPPLPRLPGGMPCARHLRARLRRPQPTRPGSLLPGVAARVAGPGRRRAHRHRRQDAARLGRIAKLGALHVVSAWATRPRSRWARSPSTASPTKSRPFPNSWSCWTSRARW